jgi:hypothetical protein
MPWYCRTIVPILRVSQNGCVEELDVGLLVSRVWAASR